MSNIEMFFVDHTWAGTSTAQVKKYTYPTTSWANSAARGFAKQGCPTLVKVDGLPTLFCRPTRRVAVGHWEVTEVGADELAKMVVYPNTLTTSQRQALSVTP